MLSIQQKPIKQNRFPFNIYYPATYEWLNFLCDTEEKYSIFMSEFFDPDALFLSMTKFQEYLHKNRTIDPKELQEAFDSKDKTIIKRVLSELYLQPLNEYDLQIFNIVLNNGYTAEDLLSELDVKKSFGINMKKFYMRRK